MAEPKTNAAPQGGVESNSAKEECNYFLVESVGLDELKGPLRGSARLRYTCMNVSNRYIALGSNTGSVHMFGRASLKHLQVVFTEVEPAAVCVVAICPSNKSVAFATINGHVIVMELNIEKRQKPERLRLITEHLHSNVTSLRWDHVGEKLYSGDSNGKVVVTGVPASKVKNLVVVPTEVIMKLDSAIVQLDWFPDKLMVSTMFRCYFCVTSKQQYYHIGKKEREGEYGGCFFKPKSSPIPYAFCARPGSRLWEVDFDGCVKNTHMFKQLLAIPPRPILDIREDVWKEPSTGEVQAQSLNFPKLKVISDEFVLTWNKKKLFILNPMKDIPQVVLWLEEDKEMKDLCTIGNDVYVFYVSGEVRKLQLLTVAQTLSLLAAKSRWSLAANIFLLFRDAVIHGNNNHKLSKKFFEEMMRNLEILGQHTMADEVRILVWQDNVNLKSDSESESSDSSVKIQNSELLNMKIQDSFNNSALDLNGVQEVMVTKNETLIPRGVSKVTNEPREIQNAVLRENGNRDNVFSEVNLFVPSTANSYSNTETSQNDSQVDLQENMMLENKTRKQENKQILSDKDLSLINSDDIFASSDIIVPLKARKLKNQKISKKSENSEEIVLMDADKHDKTEVIIDNTSRELSQEEVQLQDKDIEPLIVQSMKSDETSATKTTRRRKVNTIMFDGEKEKSSRQKSYKKPQKQFSFDSATSVVEKGNLPTTVATTTSVEIVPSESFNAQNSRSGMSRSSSVPAFSHTTSSSSPETQWLSSATHSYDGSSLDSSPSQSPLTQSYESELGEIHSGTKILLTAVKDSFQSKFANTKKKILTKMKEKNLLPISPREDRNRSSNQLQMDMVDGLTSNIEQVDEVSEIEELEEEISEACAIDISDLEACTEQTKRLLRDPHTLLNPKLLVDILSNWIKQMNVSLQRLHTQNFVEQLKKKHASNCKGSKNKMKANKCVELQQDTEQVNLKEDTEQVNLEQDSEQVNLEQNNELRMDSDDTGLEIDDTKDDIDSSQSLSNDISVGQIDHSEINSLVHTLLQSSDILHVADPFHFRPDLRNSVAELTQKCFMCGCYGSISNFVSPCVDTMKYTDICDICFSGDEQIISCCDDMTCKTYKDETVKTEYEILENTCQENSEKLENCDLNHPALLSSSTESIKCRGDNPCPKLDQNTSYSGNTSCEFSKFADDKATFIKCYFYLLDLEAILKDLYAENSVKDILYEHWCTYLTCLQECCRGDGLWENLDLKDINGVVDLIKARESTTGHLLGYVSRLFEIHPEKAVSFCVQSVKVQPLDVLFLCQYHNKPVSVHFHQYMCTRFKDYTSPNRIANNSDMFGHPMVFCEWLQVLLSEAKHDNPLADSDGNPRMWSHKVEWNGDDMIKHVLETTKSLPDPQELLEICNTAGYWVGSLMLLKQLQRYNDILKIIFHLGDIQLMSLECSYGFLPTSVEEWEMCVQCYSEFEQTHSRNCAASGKMIHMAEDSSTSTEENVVASIDSGTQPPQSTLNDANIEECNPWSGQNLNKKDSDGSTETEIDTLGCHGNCITWNDIASLMMQYLDPTASIRILSKFLLPNHCLNSAFYRSGVLAAVITRQQRNVIHNLLEKVDAYLWAKKPTSLMPELQFVAQGEKMAQKSDYRGQQTDHLMSVLSSSIPAGKRYREDIECHWGVSTKINRICRCCNLPLTQTVSHVEPGILVFDCGHVFHKFCCPNQVCLLCPRHQPSDNRPLFV